MCDFCENIEEYGIKEPYLDIDGELLYNSKENKYYIVLNDAWNDYFYEKEVDFCPLCGRKLSEEFCEECKEKSTIEKLKYTPLIEEPLPLSSGECEKETKTELPTMPIDAASMLINARNGLRDKYSKDDLQEIIEHLRAFIDNPSDD